MTRLRSVFLITLYASILFCLIILVSCNGAGSESCAVKEQSLQETLRLKDQRLAALEDSLQKEIAKNASLPAAAATDSASGTINNLNGEQSVFKKGGKASANVAGKTSKKYPGQFPEGSARVINERDVKFLSEWGLKIMLNEIYARHGMSFSDDALAKHFNHAQWYKNAGLANVDSKLSKTEKQNIRFIKNYKFSPQIPA